MSSEERGDSGGPSLLLLLPLIAIAAVLGLATVLISNGGKPALPGNATSSKSARFQALRSTLSVKHHRST